MTNNQSNELREQIENLKHKVVMGDGSEIMICEALPKAKVDALVALIQDRERLAEGRGRTAVLTSMKEWADDTELAYNNFMRDELEKLEQLKGGK